MVGLWLGYFDRKTRGAGLMSAVSLGPVFTSTIFLQHSLCGSVFAAEFSFRFRFRQAAR
jgi:hypothetical protein